MASFDEKGELQRNETLADLLRNFPFWFNLEMAPYVDHEDALPFDEHFLKALVAPRILLETEATREVYRFLGAEENLMLAYRPGYHQHAIHDLQLLINVMKVRMAGTALYEDSFRVPFPASEPIFDWRSPV